MVTVDPRKAARAARATSGDQSRVLLGGIDPHQSTTATMGKSAMVNPLKTGRTSATKRTLTSSTPTAIVPASTLESGPSSHSASAPQAALASTIADSTTV